MTTSLTCRCVFAWLCGAIVFLLTGPPVPAANPPDAARSPFRIQVVDDQTGRGVPLVELKTVNNISHWTDSNGLVAFNEPGLMDLEVFFYVTSHGYEFPRDGFGFRGTRLQITPGGSATVKIKRINIAERLYRMTGQGIYRDSVLLGEKVPTTRPVLNGQVLGSDSVQTAIFRNRLYWFWGDTNRPKYPLGLFHTPGATSRLPSDGGTSPAEGVALDYFVESDGFVKAMCRMPGDGPTWIDGLTVVSDEAGRERLFAKYVKVRPPLDIYEQGLAEFDVQTQEFRQVKTFDLKAPAASFGHPFRHAEDGVDHICYADPYPLVRVPAQAAAIADLSKYQAWSYFKPGSRADRYELDRDSTGSLRLGWKPDTLPLDYQIEQKLLRAGTLKADEAYFRFRNPETHKSMFAHRGSVAFNQHRNRWIMIFCEQFGTSLLGEIWYAEADSPTGPWDHPVKIITHEKYSFYNPMHHAYFDQDGGRVIYLEGTYTMTFSGNEHPTPWYDYNQIMYRLDLDDPRLAPARR